MAQLSFEQRLLVDLLPHRLLLLVPCLAFRELAGEQKLILDLQVSVHHELGLGDCYTL